MLSKDKSVIQNFEEASQLEWLETNGLGGWAGSTIIGTNTRRYHGLLVAAIVPPVERMALVSKLDETIITGDKRIELGTNQYMGDIVHPNGYTHLTHFSKEPFPQWHYETADIQFKKTIGMIHEENTVVIIYDVIKADSSFVLELLPLIAARDYHAVQSEGSDIYSEADFNNGILHTCPDGKTNIYISIPGASYQHAPKWFNNLFYSVERYRGLDDIEDLFNPGTFSISLQQGDSLGIILSSERPGERKAHELLSKEKQRRQRLLTNQPANEIIQQLVLAADQFIVKRNLPISSASSGDGEGSSVIAGYHWFTDWGRDTMISLPGLCLSTGRYEDAKKIIRAFAQNVSMGMLPNRFPDHGKEPEYNNVDGTLWYFIAIYKYLQATNDWHFIVHEILPVLKNIIDWHFKGTRYNIHADNDGLLYAGEKGQQLTWMDAKIGDHVVTPRMGKPVEIQALWYNSLIIFAELLQLNGQHHDASIVVVSAEKARKSFLEKFWHAKGNYLYDVIDENGNSDTSIRPNQLFAISLPFALIEGEQAKAVMKIVEEHLYTPVGLRTLSPNDPHYELDRGNDARQRDLAYHQSTVWSWLLGPYVDAMVKVKTKNKKINKVFEDFAYHLNEACIGSVSEIFDAEPPYHPRGCVAQAWGVAEMLRVMKEYSCMV